MSLLDLANELLLATAKFLDKDRDLDAFAKCNRRLYSTVVSHLYRHNVKHSFATSLDWAARSGRIETLQRAIALGVEIHQFALLPIAANEGHTACVDLLLATPGVDVNVKNADGWTSLAAAARQGHVGVVKSLLRAEPDLRTNYAGWSPLNVAANDGHVEVVKLLLDKGADVSIPSDSGWTPLKSAACNGHDEVVKLLLAHGADVHVTAERFWTPLHSAANSGHGTVVELLIDHGANTAVATADGWTPLTLAADKGRADAVRVLVAKGADISLPCGNGWTPITLAADSGHVGIIKILLECGADINSTCNNGWTPLTLAAGAGNEDMIEVLLEHGANIKTTNDSGWSSLLIAADRGHDDAVKALLSHGADVHTTNRGGLTALHAATENGNVEVAEVLLAHGADSMVGNKSGWNPVHIAAHNGHSDLIDLFLRTPDIDFNLKDNNGRTASYHAAMRGNALIVALFLSHSVSVTIPDAYNAMPIFSAVRNGHEAVVDQLLAAGSYGIDQLDGFEHNLLWWAQRSGRPDMLCRIREHIRQQDASVELDEDLVSEQSPVRFVRDACWCEVCTRCTVLGTTSYECPTCDGGYFLVCADCYEADVRCRDSSHELIPHECNRMA
ncbi:hypothetical protein QQS21_001694 [Conoideocrella luteorostrata]|uniref:Ankyrin repeat-containing domain protein n=1 Tax=Conoideocrella luteorostrata TaxID=1105319 RepID=A0AAJ0FXZ8_9HYPO|nr:hypothetical protein QQS21_001694 [Conoideocrella luteorostrata]